MRSPARARTVLPWSRRRLVTAGAAAAVGLAAASAAVAVGVDRSLRTPELITAEVPTTSPASVPSAVIEGETGTARSVILLVGDGMGDSEITLARNYQVGARGRLAMDTLPITGAFTTHSVQRADPRLPDYVTDSAAAATAWATGRKTYDGAISVTPDGRPAPTILELAKRRGYLTGDVTTAALQDATSAALAAHVPSRECRGPNTMSACPAADRAKGGPGSISEQLVSTRPDVLLGGGQSLFSQRVKGGPRAGQSVFAEARASGYTVIDERAELFGATKLPLLGTFANNTLAVEWVGPKPSANGTAPATCRANPRRPLTQPRLPELASAAIRMLDEASRDADRGFFLQIEGGAIDKQAHGADPCGQIGETIAFDDAVRVAMDYRRANPDTLVVVAADHGHTVQIVETGSRTQGATATLRTHDGTDMTVSYATAPLSGTQQHTGTQVRVAAAGPQAGGVLGLTDQTALFFTLARALGVTP